MSTYGALYNWWAATYAGTIKYGYLYNWYAATDVRNIASSEWHVSAQAEWYTIRNAVGGFLTGGGNTKTIGFDYWNSPNTDATNIYLLNMVGTGRRYTGTGVFSGIKEMGYYWSSDTYGGSPYATNLFYNSAYFSVGSSYDNSDGFAIRLVKDSTILTDGQTGTYTGNDGKIYSTICIGGLEILSENLAETKYRNGDLITKVTDPTTWATLPTEGYCAYDNNEGNAFESAIAPAGWHVPTLTELQDLSTFLGGDAISGEKLKESGLDHWDAPNPADNSSGFTALGAGIRGDTGTFFLIKEYFVAWLSAIIIGTDGELFALSKDDTGSGYGNGAKNQGVSIRLIKDDSTDPGTVTDYDGNVYPTVKIGTQVWMAANLEVTHFTNGVVIPNIIPDAEWAAMTSEAMCWYNNIAPSIPVIPSGNPAQYRIYISEVCSLTYEVFPLNFLSTTLVDEREGEQLFYRRIFNGTLIFGSNSKVKDLDGVWHNRCEDWELFWGFEQTDPCARLYIQINAIRDGVVYPYWDGYFSTTEGKFDIDRQLFEITPMVNDGYSLILDDADTQYNIIGATPEITTTAEDIGGLGTDQTYTHNHFMMDVIRLLADPPTGSPATTTVVSTFFETTPNYVTTAANKLMLLTIAQKSDIIRPASSDPVTVALLSWNELMEILRGMFQVYWIYDHLTDTIYVEHISYWNTFAAGLDLRVQALCVATNKYSYIREKMPKYERFSWMEANDSSFIGVAIRYDSDCVNQDANSNIVETNLQVTTDLEFIYKNPEAIDDDGWVILQNSGAGPTYTVEMELTVDTLDTLWNAHLSWANLHHNYFRHNRVMIEGYINNTFVTFATAQKTKKQECTAIVCENYDPEDNITTELGETYFGGEKARVNRAEIHPTGEVNFSLVYGTHYHTPTPEPPDKWIRIVMDGCTHFDAQLSEVSAINLYVEFQYAVLPESGPAVCANAAPWDVWTIPSASLTDDYDITLDCAIPSGGCIYYYRVRVFEDAACTILSEYVLDFVYDETCRC